MLILIDNYDSFTYNVYHYLTELNASVQIYRNDKISIKEIKSLKPHAIILSPGPCTPNEAGICLELINEVKEDFPILGICLGHQSIGQAFKGSIIKCSEIMHGKTSLIHHNQEGLFLNLPNPFEAIRYHSLAIFPDSLPDELEVTAWTDNGIIMGVKHKDFDVYGIQFHPESIMTKHGKELLNNFLNI